MTKTRTILGCLASIVLLCGFSCAQGHGPTTKYPHLTFTQSTSANLTSNCVYRGTVSGLYGTTAINFNATTGTCSPTPITSYDDTGVPNGTYYYAVTAVAGTSESGYSNEVKILVNNPNAPSGLSGQ